MCTINSLVEELLERSKDKRYLVFLAGIPSSGKTTLSKAVVHEFNLKNKKESAIHLSMDGFHLTKQDLSLFEDPSKAFARRGAPWTFDPQGLIDKLSLIKENYEEPTKFPSFDHKKGDPVIDGTIIMPSHKLVIVEGNYLLYNQSPWNQISNLADWTWFLNCDFDLAKKRLVKRHVETGIENDEVSALQRAETNDLINAKLILDNLIMPMKYVSIP